jgi:hypothetical protein
VGLFLCAFSAPTQVLEVTIAKEGLSSLKPSIEGDHDSVPAYIKSVALF